MARSVDHDQWVRYNKHLAEAEKPIISRDEKGQAVTKKSCSNCNKKKHCKKNLVKRGCEGTISVGGEDSFDKKVCDDWTPQKHGHMTNKQQKSLLKKFKKLAR